MSTHLPLQPSSPLAHATYHLPPLAASPQSAAAEYIRDTVRVRSPHTAGDAIGVAEGMFDIVDTFCRNVHAFIRQSSPPAYAFRHLISWTRNKSDWINTVNGRLHDITQSTPLHDLYVAYYRSYDAPRSYLVNVLTMLAPHGSNVPSWPKIHRSLGHLIEAQDIPVRAGQTVTVTPSRKRLAEDLLHPDDKDTEWLVHADRLSMLYHGAATALLDRDRHHDETWMASLRRVLGWDVRLNRTKRTPSIDITFPDHPE